MRSTNGAWRLAAVAVAATFVSAAATSFAVPIGYETSMITFDAGFKGAAALAFAPDGTLYVVEGKDFLEATNLTTIHVINPDGSPGTSIPLAGDDTGGGGNIVVGGIAVHPITGELYITDQAPGAATMYRVNPITGVKTSFSSSFNLFNIDDVAIRSTGEIFLSDAVGLAFGGGTITQVDDGASVVTSTVVSGLDFAAGLAFDSSGNLIYQQAVVTSFSPFVSHGEIYQLDITKPGSNLVYGSTTMLADNLAATLDLGLDSEDNMFVTGAGGLYELFPESVFDAQGFSNEIAFHAGAQSFEPFSGPDGGVLAYVPSFNSTTVTLITPAATAVPEPNALVILLSGLFGWLLLVNPTRSRRRIRR